MFTKFQKSLKTGIVTSPYPYKKEQPPARFRGRIEINAKNCSECGACIEACPTSAYRWIEEDGEKCYLQLSYARCIFCGICEEVCPSKAITITNDFELAVTDKKGLLVKGAPDTIGDVETHGKALKEKIASIFRRSLHVREVDAGSCNGCEWEAVALLNPVHDIQRFGIDIVASPRHADCLLVTGPPTRNLETALLKTYHATPEPRMVIALGACACSGGIFNNSYATKSGIDNIVPVDVYIPGCPPRPQAIIYGLLLGLERVCK